MRVRKVLGTLVVISSTGSSSNGITAVGSTSPPSAFPDHDVCVGGRVVESWRKYDSGELWRSIFCHHVRHEKRKPTFLVSPKSEVSHSCRVLVEPMLTWA